MQRAPGLSSRFRIEIIKIKLPNQSIPLVHHQSDSPPPPPAEYVDAKTTDPKVELVLSMEKLLRAL